MLKQAVTGGRRLLATQDGGMTRVQGMNLFAFAVGTRTGAVNIFLRPTQV